MCKYIASVSKKDLTDGNYQHIRSASEEPTRGPQFTLNHLSVSLKPLLEVLTSDMPLIS